MEEWLTNGYDNSPDFRPGPSAFAGADRHFLGKDSIEDALSEYVRSMPRTEQRVFEQGINRYVFSLKGASEDIINRICRLALLGSELGGNIDYRVFYKALEAVYRRDNPLGETARIALFQLASSRLTLDRGTTLLHWLQRDTNKNRQLEGLVLLTQFDALNEGPAKAVLKRLNHLEQIASRFRDKRYALEEFGARLASYGCDLKLADFANERLCNKEADILSIVEPGIPVQQQPGPNSTGTVADVFEEILEAA